MSVALADLRGFKLFDDLPDEEVRRWADAATYEDFAEGSLIAEQGEPCERFHLLLEGTIRALRVEDGRTEPIGTNTAPSFVGAIPLLTDSPIGVRMQCTGPCRTAALDGEAFVALVLSQRSVHLKLLRQYGAVVQRVSALDQGRERLAALGTMAAGLAHELNNPAAAATRAASDMAEALDVLGSTIGHFVESGVEREQAGELVALQRGLLAACSTRSRLDALDAADAEDELLDALEDLGVPEAWRLAEPLAAAGADPALVARVAALAGGATTAALQWIAASFTAQQLASELRESADRMSQLVGAVKTYAYMDRGGLVEIDLHEGLETTLVVLGHKLKHTRIRVEREYDRTLPVLQLHGAELNQVWTNLLDNAIDAIGDREGTITLRTRRDAGCALVELEDDGPGIPADVQARIFQPFFTTKGVGKGTGLGLDTARRIVAERHDGSIEVDSEPGRTTFRVWLPLPG